MSYKEIKGDLIKYAKNGMFDVVTHGCNCHGVMGAGIALQMNKAFGCATFPMEASRYKGDMNKLGTIDFKKVDGLYVVNSYTQFNFGRGTQPLDYDALRLCMRKLNYTFKGKKIGLPMIGAGLAGGDWNIIKDIIQEELHECDVTVVIYDPLV